jgi:hypothetical protein
MSDIKVYYLHTMELSEAASGTTGLVLESDHLEKVKLLEAALEKLSQYTIEIKVGESVVAVYSPDGAKFLSTGETLTINPKIEVFEI